MRILVTGYAGFIGSNLTRELLKSGHQVWGLDAYTYAARPEWVWDLFKTLEHRDAEDLFNAVECDLRDARETESYVAAIQPDVVLHLAAESHVCRSIEGPKDFMTSNFMGTFNLLEAARKRAPKATFIHVSTDEVFGQLGPYDAPFHEDSLYAPRSPYAASKAASDHIVSAYHHTYGLDTRITNCSNNFGPNQHEEKLIPKAILAIARGKEMTVYGDGKQVRDWLSVEDHVSGLLTVWKKGRAGERYCVGGELEMTNLEMIQRVHALMRDRFQINQDLQLVFTNDRPTDDRRYGVDSSKLQAMSWQPRKDLLDERLEATIRWYLDRMPKVAGSRA